MRNQGPPATPPPSNGASPTLVLDYSKSQLLVTPDITSLPSTGELAVRYCLKDQNGDAFDNGWGGNIVNSWTSGTVTGQNNLGGLIGYQSSKITNCWSDASLIGSGSNVGGLVGQMFGNSGLYIRNSFASGAVSGPENGVGGLVGFVENDAHYLENNFAGNQAVTGSTTVGFISGPVIGSAGTYWPPYTPYTNPIMTGLYYLNTATCTNCLSPVAHGTADSLANILAWTQNTWDYNWTWKMHDSRTRPDLIANPKP